MNNYIVYKHTTPNGKVYIGQTKQKLDYRFGKNGKGYTFTKHGFFWKAVEKYGWENIRHEILIDGLDKAGADYYEKFYIAFYRSDEREHGYNARSGGSSGYVYTESAKKNISDALKRRYKEKGFPEKCARAARETLLKKQARKIVQYDLDGNKINEFDSAYIACSETGVPNKKINAALCVPDRIKQAGGYMWRYKENAPETLPPLKPKTPVVQYDLSGKMIKLWADSADADRAFRGSGRRRAVERCCRGITKSAYGYMWKYQNDAEESIPPYQTGAPVLQYDLDGNLVRRWNNASQIKEETGWNVKAACEMFCKTSHCFQWRYETDTSHPVTRESKPNNTRKAIYQFSVDGKMIARFSKASEAEAVTGVRVGNIQTCASGKNKTAGGYVWKYENDMDKEEAV